MFRSEGNGHPDGFRSKVGKKARPLCAGVSVVRTVRACRPKVDAERRAGMGLLPRGRMRVLASPAPRVERVLRMSFRIGMNTGQMLEEVGQQFSGELAAATTPRIREVSVRSSRGAFDPKRTWV